MLTMYVFVPITRSDFMLLNCVLLKCPIFGVSYHVAVWGLLLQLGLSIGLLLQGQEAD